MIIAKGIDCCRKLPTKGSMIKSNENFEGAEELLLSSLTDFHFLHICVIITDNWACYLAWRKLGVKYITSMPLSQLASIQLKEFFRIIDGILIFLQVPNQIEFISGQVTKWMHLWIQTLLSLLRPFHIKFVLFFSRNSFRHMLKALNLVSHLKFYFQEL